MMRRTERINKNIIAFLLTISGLFNLGMIDEREVEPQLNHFTWKKIVSGIPENEITTVLAHPKDSSTIFIGTPKAVYKSTDQGKRFYPVLQPQGSERSINYLYIFISEPNEVYAATDSGLYISPNNGQDWQRIFHEQDPESRHCLSVVSHENRLYLGTQKGLYYREDSNLVWQKFSEILDNKPIHFLYSDENYIYSATEDTLYRLTQPNGTVEKVFSLLSLTQNGNLEELSPENGTKDLTKRIKFISSPLQSQTSLYLATDQGIFYSTDQGNVWQKLNSSGLPINELTSLSVNEKERKPRLYAGTNRGVFLYSDERWIPIYKGMETTKINFLTQDNEKILYAATDRGLFFMAAEKALSYESSVISHQPQVLVDHKTQNPVLPPDREASSAQDEIQAGFNTITESFQHEPTIREVQELAIDYAEVHPNKIKSWRKSAQQKALFPNLSVGLNRSATELYHWDTGPNPDKLMKGQDYLDWDVTVSWDLGDLIWNSDQTSIDSRSKLMVELREDVLDQITRLYFERRRIQLEMVSSASTEPQLFLEKQMRVEELTALIDALTGGEFSKRIENFSGHGEK